MTRSSRMVFVIDDDASVRKGLKRLLGAAGYESEGFESAANFLVRPEHQGASCLVVDVQMPGLSGIELQEVLLKHRRDEQLVFITGHGSVMMCAQAMKAGAVDFLPKPFKSRELLECIERALARSSKRRHSAAEKKEARRLLDLLTPREFQVMHLLTTGMLNKEVGAELGLALKTVKVHRGRVTQKLGLHSVVEMAGLVAKAEVSCVPGSYVQGPISVA
jgi:FixJ family two-component response regulator